MFLSSSTMPSSAHAVYFYYSLCFLLSRSSMVLLLVSAINDQAREPLQLLRLIPSEAYHQPEVSRFAAELASDQVALTGAKYFNVTRRLFLAVPIVCGSLDPCKIIMLNPFFRWRGLRPPTNWCSSSSTRTRSLGPARWRLLIELMLQPLEDHFLNE